MHDNKVPPRAKFAGRARQLGTSAVEFALVAGIFFTLVFGVIEVARLMYLDNTLQEVTRRAAVAAANTDFTDKTALDSVRQAAVFRTSAGFLPITDQVSDQAIRIDYMWIQRHPDGSFTPEPILPGSLPADPSDNRRACLLNPYCGNCIRIVRVRVCDPANTSDCAHIPFKTIFPLVALPVALPEATTLVKAERLGLEP